MFTIDAHAHLQHNAEGFDELADSGPFAEIWLMDLSGIRLNGRDLATRSEVLAAARRHPGRVRAFGFLDLELGAGEVDRLADLGFEGLKPYKPASPWNSERYFPCYRRAEELGLPILFHTGLVAPGPRWSGSPAGPGFGPDAMRPGLLAGIAEAFPDLTILGGHLGWPYLEETVQNLYFYPNIWHDLSGCRCCLDALPELLDRRCQDGTGRCFNSKLLFATDAFYGSRDENRRALELFDFWRLWFKFIGETYYRWGAPEEQEKIFGGNAAEVSRRFGIGTKTA